MSPTVRDLLLGRAADTRPGLLFEDRSWTWAEVVAEACTRSAALASVRDPHRPFHVGTLLDNTPDLALTLAAAGLGDLVLVGLNTTRRGAGLAGDIAKADVQIVLTTPEFAPLLDGLDLDARIIDTESDEWAALLERHRDASPPPVTPTPDDLVMLIFTSGTSGDPKAVRITHEKISFPGLMLAERFGLGPDDVCYNAMPLFHSNAVMAGWGVALAAGASFAMRRKFSASGFLPDVRRFGATYANYVGKPLAYVLATDERPDDADNPLRIAFGNEAGDRAINAFSARFGCVVVDGFGSTENAVIVSRVPGTPPGSLGQPAEGVAVLNPDTRLECPRATFDRDGTLTNPDEAIGELVNTSGTGAFAGYYNDPAAEAERMRDGMYWSGDLAYRDDNGFVYYAGRSAEWMRVDGENLAAGPIERVLLRHPDVEVAAVYGIPDELGGDRVMAAIVVRDPDAFDPQEFARFLAAQPDLGTKSAPRLVRVSRGLPSTATNKVLVRQLRAEGLDGSTDPIHVLS